MRKFLWFFAAMTAVLAVSSCAFAEYYNEGHMGTETDPYVIDTNADLVMLRDRVNDGTEEGDKYYRLTQNLTLSQYTDWESIGNSETHKFTGHFDGNSLSIHVNMDKKNSIASVFGTVSTSNGYAIRNLTVSGTLNGLFVAGVAHILNSGSIENCTFTGQTMYWSHNRSDSAYCGGIVRTMTGGTIRNCAVSGTLSSYRDSDDGHVGGIVATMTGGIVENCRAEGINIIYSPNANSVAGGVVGFADIANFEYIRNCTFSGNVQGYSEGKGGKYAGGIVGYISGGNVQNNRVIADMNSASEVRATNYAGGIAGRIGALTILESCDVSSLVTVSGGSEAIGGIVGLMNASTVRNNQSYASIEGDITNMGGVVGKLDAASYTISNNRYSSAEHGIGNNAQGIPSEEGCIKIGSSISITTSSLPNATEGTSYNTGLTTDSAGSVVWTLANNTTLPEGLSLSTSGIISGIPKTAGKYTFMVKATPESGSPATKEFTLTVNAKGSDPTPAPTPSPEPAAITITTSNIPEGIEGRYYSFRLEANVSGLTWSISSGYLPYGLNLDSSSGTIYGTPTYYGTYSFTVSAGNSSSSASKSFTMYIYPNDYDYYDYDEPSKGNSKGGGGCNSGFGLIGLAAVMLLKRKER